MKTQNGTVLNVYVYDAFGRLAAEYAPVAYRSACVTCFRHDDHLGSTRMVTESDVSGATPAVNVKALRDYLPFGEEMTDNGRGPMYSADLWNALKYTGQVRDDDARNSAMPFGLDYLGARYMSSAQGRFTSPGPLLNSGRPWDPQSWNRYSYARNNPLANVDPT